MSFWVGGSGNYSDAANHWAATSGGAPGAGNLPDSTKDAIFDTLSSAVGYTVTFDTTVTCKDFTVGAPLTGNVTLSTSSNQNFDVYGSISVYSSAVVSSLAIDRLTMRATTTGKTLAIARLDNRIVLGITFDGVGGGWTFNEGSSNASPAMTVTAGTVDFNGQTFAWRGLVSTGSATRVLTMGAATFSASGIGGTGFNFSGSNITFNAGTSTLTMFSTANLFNGNGLTFYDVAFNAAGTTTLTGSNTFHNLTRTGTAVKTDAFALTAGTTQTVSGTFTITGDSVVNRVLCKSTTPGTQATISAATVTVTNADFQDINGTGAGSWNFAASTAIGDCGGNTGITGTTAANQYFQSGSSANWSTAGNWFLATNGGGGAGRVPLPQDPAILDANSFTAGSIVLTQDMPRVGSVNFTGTTNTPTWTLSTAFSFFGSLTLVSGMTLSGTAGMTYEGRSSSGLTSAGKSFTNSLTVLCPSNTFTLQDAFSTDSASSITVTRGSFVHNNFAVTAGSYNSNNSNVRSIDLGSATTTLTGNAQTIWNTLTTTNLTLTSSSSTIACTYSGSTGTRSFSSGTASVGNVNVSAGSDTFSISNTTTMKSLNFTGFTGTWSGTNALTLGGSLTNVSGMTMSFTGPITFNATSGSNTITSAGKTFGGSLTFSGAGGTWTFQDAFTSTSNIAHSAGTLNTNGFSVQCTTYTTSSATTKEINLTNSTWTLTGTGIVWLSVIGGNLTITPAGSTIKVTDSSSADKSFSGGGKTYNNLWYAPGAGTGSFTISGANTFNDLKDDGTGNHSLILTSSVTQTVTTFTVSGSATNTITLTGTTTSAHNIVKTGGGTINCDYLNISNSHVTPAHTWYAGRHSTNGGNTDGWIFGDANSSNFFLVF